MKSKTTALWRARIKWDKDPLATIRNIKGGLAKRVLKKAVSKAGQEIKNAMKANAKRIQKSGAMWKAIGIKVKNIRRALVTYAVVGPRRRMWLTLGTWKYGKHAGQAKIAKPTKYAHLVERGHGGRRGPARAHEFIGPAWNGRVERYYEVMREVIRTEIEKDALSRFGGV